ncbi:MAG: DUF935 family protein [Kiritimatiellae bacterium]|nr:DUF935 family protein [Kiritimatiellia bacterium]
MGILSGISRFFFQKATNDFDANEAFRRNQLRYNALYALDPDVLVRHLSAFERGDICGLERVLDEFELREDKMKIGAFKMAAAVSSKPWEVRIRKGEEENPRAKVHQERLTKFWNRIETTDAFCRNRKGGIRLLVKQMMSAQSRVYSVHDICWKVNGDGTLSATFTHVPAWCFENRTGRLRYIRNDGQTQGEEMRDGEWLVTVGEGVGIPSAILAMAKRLSWNDWLLFSEKCGMPVIIGKTAAQRGTPAWDQLARAIRAVAPKTGLVADTGSDLSAVSMGSANGTGTYRELVDTVDRAISSLYRGGDLATMSSGPDSAGVNAQDGESELMDGDGCAMVSETLRDQVEKFVIRFECGDFEPLAEIVINPPAETEDIDREIKIDSHLAGLGVKLSKADALARYGRTEAADEKDALEAPKPAAPGPFGALPNEAQPKTPLQNAKTPLQNAPSETDGQGEGSDPGALLGPFLSALKDDCKPLAAAVEDLLKALESGGPRSVAVEKAKALLAKLPDLVPEDPALAPLLAEEMAKAFGEAFGRARTPTAPDNATLANENPYHCPKCGKFSGFNGHCDKCGYTLDADETQKRAERLMGKAMSGTMVKPIDGLAFRDEIGQIDLEVGKLGTGSGMEHGTGLAKIKQKHGRDIHALAETLAHGEIMPTTKGTKVGNPYDPDRKAIVHGTYVIFLQRKGNRRWKVSTHYKSANDATKSEEIKQWLRSGDQSHLQGGAE